MTLLFPFAIVLLASFINTLTGFGFALVSLPTLVMVMDAKAAVVLTNMLYCLLGPIFLWSARRHVDGPMLATLLLSSFAGLPLGTLVLLAMGESLLRLLIGSAIVVVALVLISNYQRPFSHGRRAAVAVGFIVGVLTTSITVSGPLAVLFLSNQGASKERLRATVGVFLLGMMPPTIALFFLSGLVTPTIVATAAQLAPAVLVGYLVALRVLPAVDPLLFRRVTILLVLGSGLTLVASEVTRLLGT